MITSSKRKEKKGDITNSKFLIHRIHTKLCTYTHQACSPMSYTHRTPKSPNAAKTEKIHTWTESYNNQHPGSTVTIAS